MTLKERFVEYIKFDTQSDENSESIPSTEKQFALAKHLAKQLEELGADNVSVDEHCYVFAEIPANCDKKIPALGFIAHMDTAPDASGENVNPQFIKNYDGSVITLNEELGMYLDPKEFASLKTHIGEEIICTDGTTLLGADDKAGVAEIMTAVEYLLSHPEIKHGKLCIGFTPDEEIGRGPEKFDVKKFGADFAYTVDGGDLGELEYENFNGANASVFVYGKSIHPGSAKNKMINAASIATEFAGLLPEAETPEHTEGYEGFYHLHGMRGGIDRAALHYIIRDHDMEKFEARKEFFRRCGEYLQAKYGENTVEVVIEDRYFNMKEKILPHLELIELAKDAMKDVGVEPLVVPIRGGTDGARLSFMGLPCPNLCTGGHNFHGPYEYCSVESMEKVTELIVTLIQKFTDSL